MIDALLNGKLSRNQENMEDILTSSVFGLMKYLPAEQGLFPYLRKTKMYPEGLVGFEYLSDAKKVTYEFWPKFSEDDCLPCEPDLVITIDFDAPRKPLVIVIEAKYLSGKSSVADDKARRPTDQLAREWDNLSKHCARIGAKLLLIYLTAASFLPKDELFAARRECETKRPQDTFICGWLSWHDLPEIFSKSRKEVSGDIFQLARRFGFTRFTGISPLTRKIKAQWKFSKPKILFRWRMTKADHLRWRFAA